MTLPNFPERIEIVPGNDDIDGLLRSLAEARVNLAYALQKQAEIGKAIYHGTPAENAANMAILKECDLIEKAAKEQIAILTRCINLQVLEMYRLFNEPDVHPHVRVEHRVKIDDDLSDLLGKE